jgi:hypothetical protein
MNSSPSSFLSVRRSHTESNPNCGIYGSRHRAPVNDVVEGLKVGGWTDYLLEDSGDPRKEYERSSWAQEGDIYFVDTGL